MGDYPFHADYLLKVDAVQIPSEKEYLRPMIEKYDITYIIYTPAYDWNVITGSEPYLKLIYSSPKVFSQYNSYGIIEIDDTIHPKIIKI